MSMRTADLPQRIEKIANRIANGDAATADRLRQLADAVRGGPNADAWASVDLYSAIDPAGIEEQMRQQFTVSASLGTLEWLRNSLIFSPLVVTWYGIYQALEHYRAAATNSDLAAKPFLLLWQEGFGGQPGVLTLGTLALIDAFLLGLIFLLTLIVNWQIDLRSLAGERNAQQIRFELADVLAHASITLTTRRWSQPTNFVDRFEDAANNFLSMMKSEQQLLADLATNRKNEIDALSAFTSNMQDISQRMAKTAELLQPIQDAQSRLQNAVATLSSHVNTLSTQQSEMLTVSREANIKLGAFVTDQKTLVHDMRSSVDKLDDTQIKTNKIAHRMSEIAQQMSDGLSNLLSTIEREREAQARVAEVVSRTNISIDNSLHQIAEYATTMHSMMIDMRHLTSSLNGLTNQLENNMRSAAREQSAAATNLTRAGTALANAAQTLVRTSIAQPDR